MWLKHCFSVPVGNQDYAGNGVALGLPLSIIYLMKYSVPGCGLLHSFLT